jgi:target of rapamycin complex subunit LST8
MTLILATAGYDHTIRFWEATTGICWRTIPHADSQVNSLEISQDKKMLAAAGNPNIRVFDMPSHSSTPAITFEGHTGNVSSIGFQKDNRWIFSGVLLQFLTRHMCGSLACARTCTKLLQ